MMMNFPLCGQQLDSHLSIGLNANRQMTVEADQTDEVNQTGEDGHDIRTS